jgi:hypothetical protein
MNSTLISVSFIILIALCLAAVVGGIIWFVINLRGMHVPTIKREVDLFADTPVNNPLEAARIDTAVIKSTQKDEPLLTAVEEVEEEASEKEVQE